MRNKHKHELTYDDEVVHHAAWPEGGHLWVRDKYRASRSRSRYFQSSIT